MSDFSLLNENLASIVTGKVGKVIQTSHERGDLWVTIQTQDGSKFTDILSNFEFVDTGEHVNK